jgi:hypothetical protein
MIRRDKDKLATIVRALNFIKPKETIAEVTAGIDNLSCADGADLLIGLTQGTPVITSDMVDLVAPSAVLIDGGKGCFFDEAIMRAQEKDIPIYRADIRAGFEGYVALALKTEKTIEFSIGRAEFNKVPVVSGGLLARLNEVVVDSIHDPQYVFGLANGIGDFIRDLDEAQIKNIEIVKSYILKK